MLGAVLEALVQGRDRSDRVDLVGRLVRPQPNDPREAQREAGAMTRRADDDVEGDLDNDRRLHLVVATEAGDRVRLEPAGHLGDLGVGQAAVRLADVDQPVERGIADRERVIGEDAVALAMPDFHADDDAIDRREGPLHLEPAESAPPRRVGALGVLDHQALIAPGARIGERGLERLDIGGGHEVGSRKAATLVCRREVQGIEARTALGQRGTQERFDRPVTAWPQGEGIERHEDDRDLGLDRR